LKAWMQVPRLPVDKGVEIVGLGLYVEELGALLVADLHLGYEEALSEQGVFLPPVQLAEIKETLEAMVREVGAGRLILLGDVKHEFGDVTRLEWRETLELLEFLTRDLGLRVEVVRGNHDNYLIPILKRLGIPLHDPYLLEAGWLLYHGHKPLPVEAYTEKVSNVALGHEHPALLLRDELGARVKLKALLAGEHAGKKVYVLPAVSPLMPGTEVNVEREPLTPLLRETGLDSFRVYAVDMEAGIFDFGELRFLKLASSPSLF